MTATSASQLATYAVATEPLIIQIQGLREAGPGAAFVPPYPYVLDRAGDIPAIVQAGVGPR